MYCKRCGNPLEAGQAYCSSCGEQNGIVLPKQPEIVTQPGIDPNHMEAHNNFNEQASNDYPVKKKGNNSAKVALVFAIIGIVISLFISIYIAIPFAIVGIVFGYKAKKELGKLPIGGILSLILTILTVVLLGLSLLINYSGFLTEVYENDEYTIKYDKNKWELDEEEENMQLNYKDESSNFSFKNAASLYQYKDKLDDPKMRKELHDIFLLSIAFREDLSITGGTETYILLKDKTYYATVEIKYNNGDYGTVYYLADTDNDVSAVFIHTAISEEDKEEQEAEVLKLVNAIEFKLKES
jgi:hypothetical protein